MHDLPGLPFEPADDVRRAREVVPASLRLFRSRQVHTVDHGGAAEFTGRVTGDGVAWADGRSVRADVILWATGFREASASTVGANRAGQAAGRRLPHPDAGVVATAA